MSPHLLLVLLLILGLPALLVQAHLVVRSELLPDELICRPLPLPALVAATGAPSVMIPIVDGRAERVAVPRFRLRACLRLEHKQRREQARQEYAAWVSTAVTESRFLFQQELPKYLNIRYSGLRAGVRSGEDLVRTGCAGCGGCARELSRSGNPLTATEAGLGAAWNEKGEAHREFARKNLAKLLLWPQTVLRTAHDGWFVDDGPHERGLRLAIEYGLSRSLGQSVQFAGSTPTSSLTTRAPHLESTVGERAGIGLNIVAMGGGELAGNLAAEGVERLEFQRLPRSLLRAGSLAGSVVVGEIVGAVVLTELEELLYRDAVAAELEEAWMQAAQGWGEEVQFAYASALAEEEEALLSWVESTWPTAP